MMVNFQVIAKSMVERKKGGVIVNVSSTASMRGLRDHAVYCSTKAAVDKLTHVMALELGEHKVLLHLSHAFSRRCFFVNVESQNYMYTSEAFIDRKYKCNFIDPIGFQLKI